MFSKILSMISIIILILFSFLIDLILIVSGLLYFINNSFQELNNFWAIFLIVSGILMIFPDTINTIYLIKKFLKIKNDLTKN